MPQIFHKSLNTLSRASIFVVVAGLPAAGAGGFLFNMTYAAEVKQPKPQPVQFSHRHHVGDDGIDCRYCHTSVEKSDSAGMPSTYTCMSCHSQLWSDSPELAKVRESFRTGRPIEWVRVHDLPDFAYFNHSIHVKKGVSCVSCHGRVDDNAQMFKEHGLTMEWCLRCHRAPENHLRPKEHVFDMAWKLPPADHSEHAGAESGSEAHAGTAHGETQAEMGKRLLREYRILSREQLTSCSTCHR